MKKLILLLFITALSYAQAPTKNVSGFVAGAALHASAIGQFDSTTKGFLFPRMTTTQRNAISGPATSLVIFNTTTGKYNFYTGSIWTELGVTDLSGYVPYTGATSDLNMGTNEISTKRLTALNGGDGAFLSEINTGADAGVFSANSDQIIASYNNGVDVYKYANEHITYDNTNGELGLTVASNSIYVTLDGIYTSAGNVSTTQDNGYRMTTFGSGVLNIDTGTRSIGGTQNIAFPTNKPSGSYTVAMTSDITTPTLQDLQAVTTVGNTTSNKIEISNTSFDALKFWDGILNSDTVIGRSSIYTRSLTSSYTLGFDISTSTDPYMAFTSLSKGVKLRVNPAQPNSLMDVYLPTAAGSIISTGNLAVADNTTFGISTYNPNDFNSSSGAISLDYANGQKASSSVDGYMIAADKTKLDAISGTNTGNETASTLGATINGSSAATPNNTDLVATVESSVVKKITWTNVKAFLKTYFDTLYGSGTVTGVSGTANRITSTGGATPVIDISSTFEGLLGKLANRIDQNNASTSSTQFGSIISDETGSGVLVFGTSPTFTTGITTPAVNLSGATASTIAEFDASKNIISASKGTAYNKNFGTGTTNIPEIGTTLVASKGLTTDASGKLKSNATSAVQRWMSGADGTSVSSSSTPTITYSQLIPAGTFTTGDVVELYGRATSNAAKTVTTDFTIYVNTTNAIPAGTTLQVGRVATAASARTVTINRFLAIKGATTKVVTNTSSADFEGIPSGAETTLTVDWATSDQYIIYVLTNSTGASDEMHGDLYKIIN